VGEHDLLIRHAIAWAEKKKRPLDAGVLEQILDLRWVNDELPTGDWPPGAAERLLLVTWPAYGSPPPDGQLLGETLDCLWGFLRATGRMSAGSASPAELRKEMKRALPKMTQAYDDPSRHSQGRVLGEFGRSIGIELDGAADLDELRRRLDAVQEAWNALPQEERFRLMPDASPKSARGQDWTRMVNNLPDDDYDEPPLRRGVVAESARDVRGSSFLRQCLALAEWLEPGRDVTQAGLLRPAVAREAYGALDLWPWEREWDRLTYGERQTPDDAEIDRVRAEAALHSWHSAGDCLPLDRLWWPMVETGMVSVGSRRAHSAWERPREDEEWVVFGLTLVASLCRRLGSYRVEPLLGLIAMPALADDAIPVAEVREWWDSRCPPSLRGLSALGWQERLDLAMFHFEDCGLFRVIGDRVRVTELGLDSVGVLMGMFDDGKFDDGSD
jgi:hypothetical protein